MDSFTDANKRVWIRGTKIYVGWPHLQERQLRVCLEVRNQNGKWVGLFARVDSALDETPLFQPTADKALLPLLLTAGVSMVEEKNLRKERK